MKSLARKINEKLNPQVYGPYKITKVVRQVDYQLELSPGIKTHRVFHVSLLPRSRSSLFILGLKSKTRVIIDTIYIIQCLLNRIKMAIYVNFNILSVEIVIEYLSFAETVSLCKCTYTQIFVSQIWVKKKEVDNYVSIGGTLILRCAIYALRPTSQCISLRLNNSHDVSPRSCCRASMLVVRHCMQRKLVKEINCTIVESKRSSIS